MIWSLKSDEVANFKVRLTGFMVNEQIKVK